MSIIWMISVMTFHNNNCICASPFLQGAQEDLLAAAAHSKAAPLPHWQKLRERISSAILCMSTQIEIP